MWTGDNTGLSMWQLQLLPSLAPSGGPLGYVIFLSDILGLFYDSFLGCQLLNPFSMKEFFLSCRSVWKLTELSCTKKEECPLVLHLLVPPMSVTYWGLIVYWLGLEILKTERDLIFQRGDVVKGIAQVLLI